jgi:hypothetical protein
MTVWPDMRPEGPPGRVCVEADMAITHQHNEAEHDLGGQVLDLIVLFGSIALFIGAIAAFIVLAT